MLTRMKKMTDRLWFRLTAAFALVIGVGVVVTVVVARQGAATQFAHFMINKHMIRPEQLQTVLVDAYISAQRVGPAFRESYRRLSMLRRMGK